MFLLFVSILHHIIELGYSYGNGRKFIFIYDIRTMQWVWVAVNSCEDRDRHSTLLSDWLSDWLSLCYNIPIYCQGRQDSIFPVLIKWQQVKTDRLDLSHNIKTQTDLLLICLFCLIWFTIYLYQDYNVKWWPEAFYKIFALIDILHENCLSW